MGFAAWFDALTVAGKIGIAFLITLAALGAAGAFVTSLARAAALLARLLGRKGPPGGGGRRNGPRDGVGRDRG